jgi:malate permease and related proteins
MTNFLLIGICIIAGVLIRRSGILPKDAHKGINTWIIYIALPAVSFKYLPFIKWNYELLFPAMAPIIVAICGWIYTRFSFKNSSLDKSSLGGLTLITSLSNTSFVGFPLVAAYFGEQEIGTAVICDQITFLLLATAGVIVAINASDTHTLTPDVIIKKVVFFPPLIGCIAALTIPHAIDISELYPLFDKLAGTVAPLALFSIGLQIQFEGWQQEIKTITISLLYKLLIAPALVLSIALLFNLKGRVIQVSIFEMSMASLLSAAVVANEYNLNPKLTNLVVGIGIVLGFFTTAIWFNILTILNP